MNIEFGKVENGKMIYVPDVVRVDGHDVISPNAEQCARAEDGPYLRNENSEPMPPEGFYAASFAWDTDGEKNFKRWDYKPLPPPPPKVYAKYYLGMAIQECGYIETLLAFLASNPVLAFHWNNANEFEEGDRNFEYIKGELAKLVGESGVESVFAKYREIFEREEVGNA